MEFDPSVFGLAFHRFVAQEYQLFGQIGAPLLHGITLLLSLLILLRGNRAWLPFVIIFTLNWLFLFGFRGVYAVFYWAEIGVPYLLSYLAAPVLLAFITVNWIRELFQKKVDLDLKHCPK